MPALSGYVDRTLTRVLGHDSGNLVGKTTIREQLTGNRSYFVLTTGDDSNTGLVNSAGGAFLTLQKAFNVAAGLDFQGFTVTVTVGAGTYTAGVVMSQSWIGGGVLKFSGDTGTPSNVLISTTSSACFASVSGVPLSGQFQFEGFKFVTTTSGHCIDHNAAGLFSMSLGCEFGACAGSHVSVNNSGATLTMYGSYTISGSAAASHIIAVAGGSISKGIVGTQTLTGTPSFAQFAFATRDGIIVDTGSNYSGSATGTRYTIDTGGDIYTGGGGANYFPGNAAGTGGTTTGGGYYA